MNYTPIRILHSVGHNINEMIEISVTTLKQKLNKNYRGRIVYYIINGEINDWG